MNFCVAVLILKMEEKQHFCHIRLYYLKNGKNTTETQQEIYAVYGEGAVTNEMYQKWFSKFGAGESLWTMFHGWANQLKLTAVKSRH